MYIEKLLTAANLALSEINNLRSISGDDAALDSIENQMRFIKGHAEKNADPREHLGENKFTFGITASRELSSPHEQALKNAVNHVTEIFLEHPQHPTS